MVTVMEATMNTTAYREARQTAQYGFTLIEVLIAVIVLSVGLLGLASLQVNALRNNQSAFMRTQATILAYDIADRMRANQGAVNAGNYDYDPSTSPPLPTPTAECITTAGCNEQQMASTDMAAWLANIQTFLPDGTGTVCRDSTGSSGCDGGGSQYAIIIQWTEQNGDTSEFVTSFQP
jgi:type IV pilus assembly protein PilV